MAVQRRAVDLARRRGDVVPVEAFGVLRCVAGQLFATRRIVEQGDELAAQVAFVAAAEELQAVAARSHLAEAGQVGGERRAAVRSEEHTSELQSRGLISYA